MDQPSLAVVVCDEGVYQYVMYIYLAKHHLFKMLFLLLGGFHLAKASFRCFGQYLKGSGIEDGLIETGVFSIKTLKQVLAGSHYKRSLFEFLVVEECIQRSILSRELCS